MKVKVAVAQIACVVGDIESNTRKIERFARQAQAKGAEMVVFPEMSDTGYAMAPIREHASDWKTGAVPVLQRLAKELSIHLVCGVSEREGDAVYNSQVVTSPLGDVIGRYRKTHLFSPEPICEDLCFTPGRDLGAFAAFGLKFGLTICYDLRFPEIFRALAIKQQTSVFVLSSAWPSPRAQHFRSLAVVRAIENQSYFVAANRVGTDNGVKFCGQSMIIDPTGVILAEASGSDDEVIMADIFAETLDSVRKQMPVFEHRRTDLYA